MPHRTTPPTPDALPSDAAIGAAFRPIVRLLLVLLREELSGDAREGWIDQTCSPLGRRRHRELARSGAFPAHKEGQKWRARRADVDAYIEAHRGGAPLQARPANDHAAGDDDDRDVRRVLAEAGLELVPQRAGKARSRRA